MARSIIGVVSADKTDKTIVVSVTTRKTHPLYRKQYQVTSRFMAHDEKNAAKVGDKVLITECRPLSAKKRFTLTKILEQPKLRQEQLAAATSEDSGKKPQKTESSEEAEATQTKDKEKQA